MDDQNQLETKLLPLIKSACIRASGNTDEQGQYIFSNAKCEVVTKIKLQNLKQDGCPFMTHLCMFDFSKAKWSKLTILALGYHRIGDKGAKHLSQAHMPSIRNISIQGNNIGNAGMMHLSKGLWKSLEMVTVSTHWGKGFDQMRVGWCTFIIRGNWRRLKQIGMGRSDLTYEQAKPIMLSKFENLYQIHLGCDKMEMIFKGKQQTRQFKNKIPKIKIDY